MVEALNIMRSAMLDDPMLAWSWHCNVACVMQDEGAPHDSANAAAARFMKAAFGVDTRTAPGATAPAADESVSG